ncbi:hypothetical protein SASPL_156239 [Salvia splendens]|uniref:Uncharacterized protein n=1 Tax=Salvia splendens TaxID=180675 RepID=A0A8X8VX13_SALSN|nr:hypothetical protein SASPL_156239 [Salvia splendens]
MTLPQKHSKSCATLASLGWEVEDINVSNHSLRRKDYNVQTFKAISHDYINRSLHLAPEAGQYMIRHSQNKFIIKACHVPAYLDLTLGVCASACNKRQYACGASNLPGPQLLPNGSAKRYIRNCSLYVLGLGNSTDGCGFFTFIDSYSLSMHLNFSECSKKYTVPLVYECELGTRAAKRETFAAIIVGASTLLPTQDTNAYAREVSKATLISAMDAKSLDATKAGNDQDDIGLANHFRSAVKQGLLSEILEPVVAEGGHGDQLLALA